MRAMIKRFHSPDVFQLSQYAPTGPFGFLLQVMACPDDGMGEESFDMILCTPEWLTMDMAGNRFRWGRHHLFVEEYDWPAIERFLRATFEAVEGDTWDEIAEELGRYGRWEFEDHRDLAEIDPKDLET